MAERKGTVPPLMKALRYTCAALQFCLLASSAIAAEPVPGASSPAAPSAPAAAVPVPPAAPVVVQADPDLPVPFDLKEAGSLSTNSPFTRALDLSDSLALTGIAYVEGKPVATIHNRATKESYVVSEDPNAQGWKLVEMNASKDLHRAEVKIVANGETVTVRYGDEQLTPGAKKGSMPGGGGPPGSGGPPGGDPNRVRTSSYLGDGGRDRYFQLSDGARDKFRELMRQRREANPNASMEEMSAFARQEFEKIEADDRKNRR